MKILQLRLRQKTAAVIFKPRANIKANIGPKPVSTLLAAYF